MKKTKIPLIAQFIESLPQNTPPETPTPQLPAPDPTPENPPQSGLHLLVQVKIGKQTTHMVLDTGASQTVLDPELLHPTDYQITPHIEIQSSGVNSALELKLGTLKKIKIGQLTLRNQTVGLTTMAHVNMLYQMIGAPHIVGLLGSDILYHHQATIDYHKMQLTLSTNHPKTQPPPRVNKC